MRKQTKTEECYMALIEAEHTGTLEKDFPSIFEKYRGEILNALLYHARVNKPHPETCPCTNCT